MPTAPSTTDGADTIYDKYFVHDPGEIGRLLQRLIDRRGVLAGHADGDNNSVITALLFLDRSSLWIDVPRKTHLRAIWLASQRLHFKASIDRIDLRFSCGPAWRDLQDGKLAFGLPLPTRLLHLQRRESMRREPPMGTLHCLVPQRSACGETRCVEATIRDIGGGGLAVLAPSQAIAFNVGDVFEGCRIDLPELGQVTVDLCVRHVIARSQRGQDSLQAGCEFIGLKRATEDKLFRYVMQLDRERVSGRRS